MTFTQRKLERIPSVEATDHGISFVLGIPTPQDSERGTRPLELINYHSRGACFKIEVDRSELGDSLERFVEAHSLHSFHGARLLKESIPFRVCWNTIDQNGMFGVEFTDRQSAPPVRQKDRDERIEVNRRFAPTLTFADATDPHRIVYAHVVNVSKSGLLISTSLSNKHLLPGMHLAQGALTLPGLDVLRDLAFTIENARHSEQTLELYLGVRIESPDSKVQQKIAEYFAIFSKEDQCLPGSPGVLKRLKTAGFWTKSWKNNFTYRIASNPKDYEAILRLRQTGYGHKGKLGRNFDWRNQGEGLDQEGTLICANWGGKTIASVELRFASNAGELRSSQYFGAAEVQARLFGDANSTGARVVEINRLVVHPDLHGTDAVVGMFQKAHSIVLSRGACDVVIAATDELCPLYERIGFQPAGLSAPHPRLEGVFLHLLILKEKTYLQAVGINPYSWSVVFEITRNHWSRLGIISAARLSLLQRIERSLVGLYLRCRKDSKPVKRTREQKPLHASAPQIASRWTRQEIAAEVLEPYLTAAEEKIGPARVRTVLQTLGVPRSWFTTQGNWLSVDFMDALVSHFEKEGISPEWLSRRAAILSLSRRNLGFKYHVLRNFLSPMQAFKAMQTVLPRLNRTRDYELLECRRGMIGLRITPKPEFPLPKHPESCSNWSESFAQYILLMTGSPARMAKPSCVYRGDPHCSWEIRWNQKRRKLAFIACIAPLLAIGSTLFSLERMDGRTLALVALSAFNFILLVAYLQNKRRHAEDTQAFEEFERSEARRYSDLQSSKQQTEHRLQELNILESTALKILGNNDLSQTLGTTLDSLCSDFGFDRVFLMMVDENRSMLRAAAISGIPGDLSDLWRFSVDATVTRESPTVVSSVFNSGKPAIIHDVKDHFHQLNEASRRLIDLFGVKRFLLVPVPGSTGNWGVMIADRGSEERLRDQDLDLLNRVSRQLGLALDRHTTLENERRRSALFQKFVPAYQKAHLMTQSNPGLGWEVRETVAMFVDIRGYTEATGTLPPSAIASFVNGFYELVHRSAVEFGGYTDKFIGDAALLTWGYLGQLPEDRLHPIRCAQSIMEGARRLNERNERLGLPPIRIGIGLHRGPAVCGVFGCDDRMEYTGIGNTANTASRLQTLTKDFGAVICVSEAVFGADSRDRLDGWRFRDQVSLRGVKDPICVAWMPREEKISGNSDSGQKLPHRAA